MNERVKEVRLALGLTQAIFGEQIGLKGNTITTIEKGIRNITDRTIMDICREFNVNEKWLRTGKGEMFVPMGDDFETLLAKYAGDLSDNMKNMIKALLKMPKEKRAIFDELLDEIVKQNGQDR